jgi:hypothetical protein
MMPSCGVVDPLAAPLTHITGAVLPHGLGRLAVTILELACGGRDLEFLATHNPGKVVVQVDALPKKPEGWELLDDLPHYGLVPEPALPKDVQYSYAGESSVILFTWVSGRWRYRSQLRSSVIEVGTALLMASDLRTVEIVGHNTLKRLLAHQRAMAQLTTEGPTPD